MKIITGSRHVRLFIIMLALVSFCVVQARAETTAGKIIMAFSTGLFSDSNIKDAKLALEIWSKKIASRVGYDYKTELVFFKDLPSLLTAVRQGEVDFVQLLSPEYLRMKDKEQVEPLLVGIKNGTPYEILRVFVHKDNPTRQLRELKGKKIIIERGIKGELPLLWLNTMLRRENLPPAARFFGNITIEDQPAKAILPVYFRQADACLAATSAYDTMIELNPRIGETLKVIRESPGYVYGFFGIRRGIDEKMREALLNAGKTLNKETEGKQILTLFRFDAVEPFKPEYMKSMAELVTEHDRAKKQVRK